jgi:hypothetical protein
VSVVCCQVEVSAKDLSLVQMSYTECGVPECDSEASTVRKPWPTGGVAPRKQKNDLASVVMIRNVNRIKRSLSILCVLIY